MKILHLITDPIQAKTVEGPVHENSNILRVKLYRNIVNERH